ncbi:MAG: response regulator [Myxococcales bacterium]|nr:response regulator [Myxococcales bacterium]
MKGDWGEKREHRRVTLILKVVCPDRAGALGATENLSKGGLFVQTEERFELGERVALALSFPGLLDPIQIVGRVVWLRPARGEEGAGVGVAVESEAERLRLEQLVNASDTHPSAATTSALPAEGFRVLIVEDNPHIIEMYSYVLKKLAAQELGGKVPFEVHFAPDGHHALKLLEEGRFNLVLTDLYMPVMDGFILVERIRQSESWKSIPVVVISAGGADAQARAMQLGVDIYLRKPVKFTEVLETVKRLLRIG